MLSFRKCHKFGNQTIRNRHDCPYIGGGIWCIKSILPNSRMVCPLTQLGKIARALQAVVRATAGDGDGGDSVALVRLFSDIGQPTVTRLTTLNPESLAASPTSIISPHPSCPCRKQ